MLIAFAKKLFAETLGKNPTTTGGTFGTLTDIELHIADPVYGEVNGHPVTIAGQGNMVGFSPVSWCIDGQGENAWLPTHEVLITDVRLQPGGPTVRHATTTARK